MGKTQAQHATTRLLRHPDPGTAVRCRIMARCAMVRMLPGMDTSACIRPAQPADAAAISAIYNHYVLTSTCTFREEPETLAERERWLGEHTGTHVVLVAEEPDGTIAGWASLSRFHERSAYRFTVEDSIYLRDDRRGRGLGVRLLAELMACARQGGFRCVMASITAEQQASLALHRRFGFTDAAYMRQVGFKFGRWLDVVYLQADLQVPT